MQHPRRGRKRREGDPGASKTAKMFVRFSPEAQDIKRAQTLEEIGEAYLRFRRGDDFKCGTRVHYIPDRLLLKRLVRDKNVVLNPESLAPEEMEWLEKVIEDKKFPEGLALTFQNADSSVTFDENVPERLRRKWLWDQSCGVMVSAVGMLLSRTGRVPAEVLPDAPEISELRFVTGRYVPETDWRTDKTSTGGYVPYFAGLTSKNDGTVINRRVQGFRGTIPCADARHQWLSIKCKDRTVFLDVSTWQYDPAHETWWRVWDDTGSNAARYAAESTSPPMEGVDWLQMFAMAMADGHQTS